MVRPFVAWYWRALRLSGVVLVSLSLVAISYRMYRPSQELDGQSGLAERFAALESQSAGLRGAVQSSDSRLQVERSAQQQLAVQVRALEEENARLKEELAFLNTLLSSNQKGERRGPSRAKSERDVHVRKDASQAADSDR